MRAVASPAVLGFISAATAFALAMLGAGRGYGYDESVTVGAFVSRDLWTPFTEQVAHNNHPFFSFVESLAWQAGATTEATQRVLPALFGATAVGLVAYWCSRRWGALAGVMGAAVLAVHPLFLSQARQVRGYSLLILAATASTFLLIELLEIRKPRRWVALAYVCALAVGFATHLYMAAVLLAHVGLLGARRQFTPRMVRMVLSGLVLGLFAYVQIVPESGPKRFFPAFPRDAAWDLFGSHPVAILILGACAACAIVGHRRDWPMVVLPLLGVAMLWLVVQPLHLYPRFLIWLVPGVAGAAAWVVGRSRWTALPLVTALVTLAPALNPPHEFGLREAARVVDSATADGLVVCAVGAESLVGYADPPPELIDLDQGCEFVVVVGSWHEPTVEDLEDRWGIGATVHSVRILAPPEVLASLEGHLDDG
ncbi:MAG: hypothetical protein GY788_13895 [bacterium]|nr:hypothetical protein [bacterium]